MKHPVDKNWRKISISSKVKKHSKHHEKLGELENTKYEFG